MSLLPKGLKREKPERVVNLTVDGYKLQLTATDHAAAMKCYAFAGPVAWTPPPFVPGEARMSKPESPEPTKPVECPKCGRSYQMADYLADALESRQSAAPICSTCRDDGPENQTHWTEGT